jgi:hypothetical protein
MTVGMRKAIRFTLLIPLAVGYLLAEIFESSGFSFSDAALLDVPLTVVAFGVSVGIYAATGGTEETSSDSK